MTYAFGIVAAALAVLSVLELLRRKRIRERHGIWALVASILALIIAIFPSLLIWAADLAGISTPINLAFFVSIIILFLVSVQSSAELTKLEGQSRSLAERIALVEAEVVELKNEKKDNQ